MIKTTSNLSIAIVSYKTADLTRKLLVSLMMEDPILEVVVLDNGSDDGIGEMIPRKFPKVKFIQSETNLGFSKGYNQAIGECHRRYILLLNSDIEVKRGSLEKLLNSVERFGERAVYCGRLILPDGSVQKSAFHLPTVWGAVKQYLLGFQDSYFSYLPDQNQPSKVEGAVMAMFLIPKQVWDEVGKLDEGTELYFEDVEYCSRLKDAGIPIYYIPETIFYHQHGASAKKLPEGEALKKIQQAAKRYHGYLKYYLLTFILWLGQKIRSV